MSCKPENIKEPHYLEIWKRLQDVNYPATIVVYGSERTNITSHNRSEYPSAFGISLCSSPEEAWNMVDCDWSGYPPYLKVYAIPTPNLEPVDLN